VSNVVYLRPGNASPPEPSNAYATGMDISWDDEAGLWRAEIRSLAGDTVFESDNLMEVLHRFFHMADASRNITR
jgi:hypothetical protein